MADSGSMSVAVVGAAIIRDGRLRCTADRASASGRRLGAAGRQDRGRREDEEALVRECREELGVEVRLLIGSTGTGRCGPAWPYVWSAEIVSGEPMALADHSAIWWLAPDELYDVAWLPADLPIARRSASGSLLSPGHASRWWAPIPLARVGADEWEALRKPAAYEGHPRPIPRHMRGTHVPRHEGHLHH
jgi:8-oxo-dGTP diphosphatase